MSLLNPALAGIAACVLAFPAARATAQETRETPAGVRIYDPGELPLQRYTVLRRIWTGTWRAAFWVPSHPGAPAAIEALKAQAAGAGADGVINLHCLSAAAGSDYYYCYGLAIKLK